MGQVKETVKGSGPAKKTTTKEMKNPNLLSAIDTLRDEVSNCISIKDKETETEGKDAATENFRKANVLRAADCLLRGAKLLLEMY